MAKDVDAQAELAKEIDYKYFVEPNIPRIKIEDSLLDEIRKEIPVLPNQRLIKYITEYNREYVQHLNRAGSYRIVPRDLPLRL